MASPSAHNNDAQFAGLAQRVTGLETGLSEIKSSLTSLINRLDSTSRPQWTTIISAVSLMGAALIGYITIRIDPLNHELDRTAALIEKMGDRFTPASSINDRFDAIEKGIDKRFETAAARRDDWQRNAELRSRDNRDDIVKLRESVVTRKEHEQHWDAERLARDAQQREIDGLKATLGSLYSARDVLKDDHEQIRALELQLLQFRNEVRSSR